MDEQVRNIPQVERVLEDEKVAGYIHDLGRSTVLDIIRRILDRFREKAKNGGEIRQETILASVIKNCGNKKMQKLQKVINGTGVLIHTNLGRSPLGGEVLKRITDMLTGYCNLEYHLTSEKRGRRGGFSEELICHLTGAEDALIVNNCAASVYFILNCFARGKEVIVSRGELIQIGGGFRIPDIMKESSAELVEVGTSNITEADDYRNAITERTAMILSTHHSNFRMEGFTGAPTLKELAQLKSESILFVRDIGSGNLLEDDSLSMPFEPTVQHELSLGPDLVCFSGDKLLGGSQAGIIIGRKDLIGILRKHPLMRMLRVDKITYAVLQEMLILYDTRRHDNAGLWALALGGREKANSKATRLLRRLKHPMARTFVKRFDTRATFGGGSLPGMEMESVGVEIEIPGVKSEDIYSYFIASEVPIIGAIKGDRFSLDMMTVFDDDLPLIAQALEKLVSIHAGNQ